MGFFLSTLKYQSSLADHAPNTSCKSALVERRVIILCKVLKSFNFIHILRYWIYICGNLFVRNQSWSLTIFFRKKSCFIYFVIYLFCFTILRLIFFHVHILLILDPCFWFQIQHFNISYPKQLGVFSPAGRRRSIIWCTNL